MAMRLAGQLPVEALQLSPIWRCNILQKYFATFAKKYLQKTTYYYWRKRISANDEMLSVKEPVFAELTNIRKAALSEEKEPLLISFNQLQLAVSTPAQAELAAVLISRMQSLC